MLGSSFGTNNFGVSVLTLGTVQCLLHAFPGADISILDYGRESTLWNLRLRGQNVRLPLINIRFSKKPWQSNHIACLIFWALIAKLTPFAGMRRRIISGNSVLEKLEQMDFVTAISGGDSFSDIYGMTRFIYVALPQILALLLEKRLILLPQTLGPFRARLTKKIARFILRGANRIYTRDRKSVEVAQSFLNSNAPNNLHCTYDVGFVVQSEQPDDPEVIEKIRRWKRNGCLVGLNVSGLLFMGGYSRNNMFALKTDYRQLTYAIIDWFRTLGTGTLLLVPHVLGGEGSESDSEVCQTIYREFQPKLGERIQLLDSGLNERETKFVVGECDFFSGARMHACIGAISQCVPSVPIAYSDKFIGVMETVGVEGQVADPRKMTKEEIVDLVSSTFKNREAIRSVLRQTIPNVIESTLQLFIDLQGPLRAPVNAVEGTFEQQETPTSTV
jgi:colanic acid/amylovoran biosynthesis protein